MLSLVTLLLFLGAGLLVAGVLEGYTIVSSVDTLATSNPLKKTVEVTTGAWLNNYQTYPWMIAAPVLAIMGGLLCAWSSRQHWHGRAFTGSALMITGIIATAGCSMFPFLLPSSLMPDGSLTIWDATSSHRTLLIMFIVAAVFVPLVLAYTAFGFYKMHGRISTEDLDQSHTIY